MDEAGTGCGGGGDGGDDTLRRVVAGRLSVGAVSVGEVECWEEKGEEEVQAKECHACVVCGSGGVCGLTAFMRIVVLDL